MYLKPTGAEMAFTAERVYGSRVIHADFALFGIVTNAHSNVCIACPTVLDKRMLYIHKQPEN